jgi:hypothetical protein
MGKVATWGRPIPRYLHYDFEGDCPLTWEEIEDEGAYVWQPHPPKETNHPCCYPIGRVVVMFGNREDRGYEITFQGPEEE